MYDLTIEYKNRKGGLVKLKQMFCKHEYNSHRFDLSIFERDRCIKCGKYKR